MGPTTIEHNHVQRYHSSYAWVNTYFSTRLHPNSSKISISSMKRKRPPILPTTFSPTCTMDPTSQNDKTQPDPDIQSQYAQFAEALRVEPPEQTPAENRAEIQPSAPTTISIDPADYEAFDNLLKRSGGTGRKPMKGSKRYMSHSQQLGQLRSKHGNTVQDANLEDASLVDEQEENQPQVEPEVRKVRHFSQEEINQGYETMMEQFGTGMHVKSVTPSSESKSTDMSLKSPPLQRPPSRPQEILDAESQAYAENDSMSAEEGAGPSSSMATSDSVRVQTLQPKPTLPVNQEKDYVSEHVYSDEIANTALQEPSPAESKPPPPLLPKPQSHRNVELPINDDNATVEIEEKVTEEDGSEYDTESIEVVEQLPRPHWDNSNLQREGVPVSGTTSGEDTSPQIENWIARANAPQWRISQRRLNKPPSRSRKSVSRINDVTLVNPKLLYDLDQLVE